MYRKSHAMSPPIVHQYFTNHIPDQVGVKRNRAANGVVRRGSCGASHSPVSGARAHVGGACTECTVFALFSICPVIRHRNSGAIFSLVGIQRLYRDLIYLFLFGPLSLRFMRVDLFMRFIGVLIQVTKRLIYGYELNFDFIF